MATAWVGFPLVLTNAAVVNAANFSAGFNGGNAVNLPKGSITLNNNSTFTVTGNGTFHLAESAGSDMTLTLNNSAQFITTGTGAKELGEFGKAAVYINDSSSMILGNLTNINIGYRTGTGAVTMASSGTPNVSSELRVGGSDQNGTARNAFGAFSRNHSFEPRNTRKRHQNRSGRRVVLA